MNEKDIIIAIVAGVIILVVSRYINRQIEGVAE